jgi:hypothetical protein
VSKKRYVRLSGFFPLIRLYTVTYFKLLKKKIMEKFMLIFQGGLPGNASSEEMQANMGKWMAWIEKLSKDDRYVSGEPLLPGGKVIKGSAKNVKDGPFTEGKEIVGGFFIIKAKDYDEAVALCADYPDYDKGGVIQLRQVMKMDM